MSAQETPKFHEECEFATFTGPQESYTHLILPKALSYPTIKNIP